MPAKIVPFGNGFESPRALLASLLERADDLEWLAITYQDGTGRYSDATNNMTIAELALISVSWSGIVHKLGGI